ncbi:hypothetical protein ACFL5O_09105, partial [Myxococcota bacterium]
PVELRLRRVRAAKGPWHDSLGSVASGFAGFAPPRGLAGSDTFRPSERVGVQRCWGAASAADRGKDIGAARAQRSLVTSVVGESGCMRYNPNSLARSWVWKANG